MIGFRIPTHVHIAPGARSELTTAVSELSLGSLLLVSDPGLRATPWPDEIEQILRTVCEQVERFEEVEPNPRTATAERIAETLREHALDGVVGLGGGSVLDAAKAGAMLAQNPGPARTFEGKNRFPNSPLPFIAIPTTCGTGSEVTWVSVLSDVDAATKISVKGESMFPNVALVDADLIRTLPPSLVAWTGLDALTHALEATTGAASNPVSDALAEKAITLLFHFLPRAVADIGRDDEARNEVMRASTVAGLAFGNADVAAVHCLSETLGGLYDVPHGLANAVLLPPILRYHRHAIGPRLAELAQVIAADAPVNLDEAADFFLDRLDTLSATLDTPSFASFNVPTEAYANIADRATRNGSNGSNPQEMKASNYLEILESL